MRRDQHIRHGPQRVAGRQRLRLRDVEGGADPPGGQTAVSASVSTTGPRAALTRSAPSRIAFKKPASTKPVVAVVSGTKDDDVRLGQQVRQFGNAVYAVAGLPGDADQADVERGQPCRHRLADVARADDENVLASQLSVNW